MVVSGCTVISPIILLYIQAGQIMGGVKNKYAKYEAVGEQCVGRCATYLDQLDERFSISLPQFDLTNLNDEEKEI